MADSKLIISPSVFKKLREKHNITEDEIEQCFLNMEANRVHLKDTRADHQTDPPSLWFISETDKQRKLKIVWMNTSQGVVIKTAFEPNDNENRIYTKNA
jgi:hypothetical protein